MRAELKLLSLVLQYPSDELLSARAELAGERCGEGARRFLEWFAARPPGEVRREYRNTLKKLSE